MDHDRDGSASRDDRDALDRNASARERDASSTLRDDSSALRDAASTLRDESSTARDASSSRRDVAADGHDVEATDLDAKDDAADRDTEHPDELRSRSRSGRARAAEDRTRAAADRERATQDRAHAVGDRQRAEDDREKAGDDRQGSERDREQAGFDRENAGTDELTGARRRGIGLEELEVEIARARRESDGQLVAAFVDVDGLKVVNDSHGHAAGDDLLQTVAEGFRRHMRSYDLFVRVGGDEFLCVLPNIDADGARLRFSKLREELDELDGTSVSIGYSELRDGDTGVALVDRADRALITQRRSDRA